MLVRKARPDTGEVPIPPAWRRPIGQVCDGIRMSLTSHGLRQAVGPEGCVRDTDGASVGEWAAQLPVVARVACVARCNNDVSAAGLVWLKPEFAQQQRPERASGERAGCSADLWTAPRAQFNGRTSAIQAETASSILAASKPWPGVFLGEIWLRNRHAGSVDDGGGGEDDEASE